LKYYFFIIIFFSSSEIPFYEKWYFITGAAVTTIAVISVIYLKFLRVPSGKIVPEILNETQ
jgi:hypothetical protein